MELEIEIDSESENLTILTLKGSADLHTSPLLRECLADVIGAGRDRLAVDLAAVRSLDAAAHEVLIDAMNTVAASGGILCLIIPPSASVASQDDLGSAFMTFESKAEALEQLPPRKP